MTKRQRRGLFGVLLRTERDKAGLSQAKLATHLGISSSFLSDVEVGRRRPLSAERIRACGVAFKLKDNEVAKLLAAAAEDGDEVSLALPSGPIGRQAAMLLFERWELLREDDFVKLVQMLTPSDKE